MSLLPLPLIGKINTMHVFIFGAFPLLHHSITYLLACVRSEPVHKTTPAHLHFSPYATFTNLACISERAVSTRVSRIGRAFHPNSVRALVES